MNGKCVGRICVGWMLLVLMGVLPGCAGLESPDPDAAAAGRAIIVAGQRLPVDAPVVLWTDPGGYDAHALTNRFAEDPGEPKSRYDAREPRTPEIKAIVADEGWSLRAVREQVDQFVLHYDVAGTSRSCFRVLHDMRGLSVHFLLDLDGTIYQTLDLQHRGWHATKANHRSVGIEIANIGAYPPSDERGTLASWYDEESDAGPRVRLPDWLGDGGIRTRGFVAEPARSFRVRGVAHGRLYEMYDLTHEQYESLTALSTALCRAFPNMVPDAPRDEWGRVRTDALTDAEFDSFGGLIGHLHIQTNKIDPGPAFDWERVIRGARAQLSTRDELATR